tara:strand:- start:1172 stop:1387 length:216 start_codon:yes stop_codon:yes gene_type:complete
MSASDIDEVLSRDTEGKLNWLVGEVTEIKQDVLVIKNNHLTHIESDMSLIKRVLSGVVVFLIAAFTGIQVM